MMQVWYIGPRSGYPRLLHWSPWLAQPCSPCSSWPTSSFTALLFLTTHSLYLSPVQSLNTAGTHACVYKKTLSVLVFVRLPSFLKSFFCVILINLTEVKSTLWQCQMALVTCFSPTEKIWNWEKLEKESKSSPNMFTAESHRHQAQKHLSSSRITGDMIWAWKECVIHKFEICIMLW